jgi:hypothetical protein
MGDRSGGAHATAGALLVVAVVALVLARPAQRVDSALAAALYAGSTFAFLASLWVEIRAGSQRRGR